MELRTCTFLGTKSLDNARDPLAATLAFAVQVRLVLATVLGIRMCPECPHCAETDNPCMDAFGSCAEAMGGIAGRCDGIAGAVECQKSKGSLHLHFWCYVQRVHQYKSLEEIGKLLEEALVTAADLKRFAEHLCNESYPLSEGLDEEINELERQWPCFKETDGAAQTPDGAAQTPTTTWGEHRIGRIPPFVWEDRGTTYTLAPLPQITAIKRIRVLSSKHKRSKLHSTRRSVKKNTSGQAIFLTITETTVRDAATVIQSGSPDTTITSKAAGVQHAIPAALAIISYRPFLASDATFDVVQNMHCILLRQQPRVIKRFSVPRGAATAFTVLLASQSCLVWSPAVFRYAGRSADTESA